VFEDEIVGAIGVSGAAAVEQDVECATAGSQMFS
jgi:uncharacterized protein GlcG (DUF336 family)